MGIERHTQLSPLEVYRLLLSAYGRQDWQPADTPFEVMVNAILSQGTTRKNAEVATTSLKDQILLDCEALSLADSDVLAEVIKGSGFHSQKAKNIIEFAKFYSRYGTETGMKRWPVSSLRSLMLKVKGIGPETADSIILYGLDKPTFVVSTRTKRLFSRIGQFEENSDYQDAKQLFMNCLPHDLSIFKELNALVHEHTKRHCCAKPNCDSCPLGQGCKHGKNEALKTRAEETEIQGTQTTPAFA